MTFPCLGPLPDYTPPRFEMPAGSTDTHAHVIGLPPDYPFVAERSYTPPKATIESYMSMHRALGIERAVLVNVSVHGTDNRAMLEGIKVYGPDARGIAVVDEDVTDTELQRLHDGGIRGLRLNVLFGGGVGLGAFKPLAGRVKDMGWNIQLLMNVGDNMIEMEPLVRELGVPVVIDHMGFYPATESMDAPAFQCFLNLVKDGIVWVKVSGNYRISAQYPEFKDAVPVAKTLIEACPEHIVWGTDWPHVSLADNMPNTGDLLNALDDYAPDPELKKMILVDNPAKLYGFE